MCLIFHPNAGTIEKKDALHRILSRDRAHERRFADALREQVLDLMAKYRPPVRDEDDERGFPSTPQILVDAEQAVRAYDKNKERRK
jgi:hypothetical protein